MNHFNINISVAKIEMFVRLEEKSEVNLIELNPKMHLNCYPCVKIVKIMLNADDLKLVGIYLENA